MRHVPHEDHLEAGEAVVAQRAADKDPVLLVQLPNLDPVVQNDRPGVGSKKSCLIPATASLSTLVRLAPGLGPLEVF